MELLRELKSSSDTWGIPVIMATAKGAEYDKIQSLDLGADDYLVKPFGMMEMVSRVKAVLRRCRPRQERNVLAAGGLTMDLEEHTVIMDGQRLPSPSRSLNCCVCSLPTRALPSPESSCCLPSGEWIMPERRGQWMCTSKHCGRSWGRMVR